MNGFMDDLSSEAQTRRARMGDVTAPTQAKRARKSNTPWRKEPACDTPTARLSFLRCMSRAKNGTPTDSSEVAK